jgi:hypothetical protein
MTDKVPVPLDPPVPGVAPEPDVESELAATLVAAVGLFTGDPPHAMAIETSARGRIQSR